MKYSLRLKKAVKDPDKGPVAVVKVAAEPVAKVAKKVVTPNHPAIQLHAEKTGVQERLALRFTEAFFSPYCFYIHVVIYLFWMLWIEHSPWQRFLSYISVEAVLVAILIGIGQKAGSKFDRIKADHDYVEQTLELKANTKLTKQNADIARKIHKILEVAEDIHEDQERAQKTTRRPRA